MTNKINDIDVSGAELYEKNVQLQEENEELKEKIHFKNLYKLSGKCFFDEARECHYFEDFVKTKQENKDLKEQVDDLAKDLKVQNGIIGKFEQALEEIKKWATNHNPCDIEAGINCTKEDCFECLNYDIKKITRIINEVLNDRD